MCSHYLDTRFWSRYTFLMQTIRAFIAGELSSDTKQTLKTILSEFQNKSDRRFRWIPLENIHLTLKFIGNIELNTLEQIKTALASIVPTRPEIAYHLEKFGIFPHVDHPRIFWLGVKAPTALIELVDMLEENAARYGIQRETRPFTPHLTLCRFQPDMDKTSIRDFMNSLSSDLLNFSCQDLLNNITVFKSTLTPKGALYTPITRFYMQKNPLSI
jgi:RNA 2',3'-cyclic 3'-phosphodiesterase